MVIIAVQYYYKRFSSRKCFNSFLPLLANVREGLSSKTGFYTFSLYGSECQGCHNHMT